MAKFRDKTKAKTPARLCRFRRHENPVARHDRRYEEANSRRSKRMLRQWCEAHGLKLTITNDGHHFSVRSPADDYRTPWCQWWPRTAKLVFCMNYRHGIHVHDVCQVIEEMATRKDMEK